jgi:surface polysaccharide O-acyltransferase-like enzyme
MSSIAYNLFRQCETYLALDRVTKQPVPLFLIVIGLLAQTVSRTEQQDLLR